jgi:hypothetical protein
MKLVQAHKPAVEMEQTTYHALAEAGMAAEKAKFVRYRLRAAIDALQSIPAASADDQAEQQGMLQTHAPQINKRSLR